MNEKRPSADTKLIPPVFFLIAIAVMVCLHYLLPLHRWLGWPWQLLGVVLAVAGLTVAVMGERRFKHHGTAVRPFQPVSTLVTDGVFRYTRNPMYLGMVLVLAGIAVFLGTISPLVVVPVFAWLITTRFIRHEEQMLHDKFVHQYAAYRARVRRWL